MSRRILNGWKEISGHLERSIRTVQRWEVLLGLPVYRPALKDKSAVVAFPDELDLWISRGAPTTGAEAAFMPRDDEHGESLQRVLENMNTVVSDSDDITCRMQVLQEQLRQSLSIYRRTIALGKSAHGDSAASGSRGPVLAFTRGERSLPFAVAGSDSTGLPTAEKTSHNR